MADKKLIMFDFDGVLVNTLQMCFDINAEADTDITLPQYQALFSGNIMEMVKKTGFKGNPNFFGRYAEESRRVTIPEEMKKLVRKYAGTHTLSIISGSETSSILDVVVREGIADCFADVLGYDVDPQKTVRIKTLLKQYDALPDDALFITDTSGDVYEAAECEVPAVAVTWGFQDKETLTKSAPMAFADTAQELDTIIAEYFSGTM